MHFQLPSAGVKIKWSYGKVNWNSMPPWGLSPEGWWSRWFISVTNPRWVKAFDRCCFLSRIWGRVSRTDASPHTAVVFVFFIEVAKDSSSSMLLLFGPVTLLCGTFLCIWLSEGPVQLSDCTTDTPSLRASGLSVHTGTAHQKCSPDTTSRGGSAPEWNFPPLHIWNFHTEEGAEIGAGSQHANGSVKEATERTGGAIDHHNVELKRKGERDRVGFKCRFG